jgi:N-acetyl-anhydromuramyl-L-alanine amidase AmpD
MTPQEYNDANVPIFAPQGLPDWCEGDEKSVGFLKALQHDLKIKIDGYCGPGTIQAIAEADHTDDDYGLYIGPMFCPTMSPTLTFVDDFTLGDTAVRTRREAARQIVIHYDVAWNARAAESILQKRGYSTHFIIDHDGTIVQCHNPATKVAFHAGKVNNYTIGIDLNNPADPKYQGRDAKKRGGNVRPLKTDVVHGGVIERLDYFPAQIEALNELLIILCNEFGISKTWPPEKRVLSKAEQKQYGIIGHYHLTKRKTDPSPLDWDTLELG